MTGQTPGARLAWSHHNRCKIGVLGLAKTKIWALYGNSISQHPQITLGAYLGQPEAISLATKNNIGFPCDVDFGDDKAYEANPYGLKLSGPYLEHKGLVLNLLTWGPGLMTRVVNACSLLQCAHQMQCKPEIQFLRDQAMFAVHSYSNGPSAENLKAVWEAVYLCRSHFEPYADDPDSKESGEIWFSLGAPWFAAETIVSDWSLQIYDGEGPPESQSTWINRLSVYPCRCADALSHWMSDEFVYTVIKATAEAWVGNRYLPEE